MFGMTLAQILVILSLVVTLGLNGAANALPLNGQTTGEISDRFPTLFVPAGYVFSIWGVIYLALIAFTVYQALPANAHEGALASIRWLVVALNLLNALWLFLWHYERFPLTLVVMLGILGLLLTIYLRLNGAGAMSSGMAFWAARVPFSLYLGWISVATIANASQWLYSIHWNGFGLAPSVWAMVMIAAAVGLAIAMLFIKADPVYGLVIIWALIGIAVKQVEVPVVAWSAWSGATVTGVLIIARSLFTRAG